MKSINFVGSRLVKNRFGVTIIEALIALAIIVIASLATASFFIHQNRMTADVSRQASCRATVEAQIAYFRQQGTTPHAMTWTHATGADSPTPLMTSYQDPWLSDTIRRTPYQSQDLLDGTGGAVRRLYSAYLERSALGTLASLYNQNPAVCASPINISTLPVGAGFPLLPPPDSSLVNFNSTIQIEPIDTDTNSILAGCPTNMWPRPRGTSDAVAAGIIQFPAEIRSNLGFRVTAVGSYEDASGRNMSCVAKEDFTFPIDHGVVAPSVLLNVYEPLTSDVGAQNPDGINHPNCSLSAFKPSTLRLEIGFQSALPFEPGSVFLCRDVSQQLNPNYCSGAPGAQARNQPTPAAGPWVPCDKVTACGVPPDSSVTQLNPSGGIKYVNSYSTPKAGTQPEGLYGCDIRLDVATVDMAGNFVRLSDRARPDGLADTIAQKYYDLPECWACYKKKKRSWGSFIISTIIIGPIVSCLAGVGGVCRSKGGLRFIGNRCNNQSGGSTVCLPVKEARPTWNPVPPGPGNCPAETGNYPPPMNAATYTFPASTNGSIENDNYWDAANGIVCEAEAVCQAGSFVGIPDETNTPVKASCSKLYTVKRVDISTGTPTPSPGLCIIEVPIGPGMAPPPSANSPAYYSGYSMCTNPITGMGTLLCVPNLDPVTGTYSPTYPPDPATGGAITNPNGYLYYEPVTTTPIDPTLPMCQST